MWMCMLPCCLLFPPTRMWTLKWPESFLTCPLACTNCIAHTRHSISVWWMNEWLKGINVEFPKSEVLWRNLQLMVSWRHLWWELGDGVWALRREGKEPCGCQHGCGRAGKRGVTWRSHKQESDDVGQGPADSSSKKPRGKQFSISHYMVLVAMAPFCHLQKKQPQLIQNWMGAVVFPKKRLSWHINVRLTLFVPRAPVCSPLMVGTLGYGKVFVFHPQGIRKSYDWCLWKPSF